MAAKSFQITLTAAAKRLSDVYGGAVGAHPDPTLDIPYRQLLFTTDADAVIGSDSAVSTGNFGVKILAAAPLPTSMGPFETGPIKLSQLWGVGSGVLHMLGIPF